MKAKWLLLTGVMLAMGWSAVHAAGDDRGRDVTLRISAEPPVKKSRLKFKQGPTCMCVRGTSEEDIRRAEEMRQDKGQ